MWKSAVLIAILGLIGPLTGTAEAANGRCSVNEAVYHADSQAELASETTAFTDMPGVSVNFVQGGTATGCAIVTFSAESSSPAGMPTGFTMQVRPILDDDVKSVPASTDFAANDPDLFTTRTATFVFRSVSPGSHTIRMQFRTVPAAHSEIGAHTLVVQHQR